MNYQRRSKRDVINFKSLLLSYQKYNVTQYEELGFSKLTQMKDDYTIKFLPLTNLGEHTF